MDKRIALSLTGIATASVVGGLLTVAFIDDDKQAASVVTQAPANVTAPLAEVAVQNPRDNSMEQAIKADISTLTKQISQLKREVASLSKRLEQRPEPLPTVSDANHKSLDDQFFNNSETQEAVVADDGHDATDIATRFEDELVESAWSKSATGVILRAIDQSDFPQSAVLSLDCRSTICRAEVEVESPEQRQGFLQDLPMQVGDSVPLNELSATYDEDDPTGAMVLHLSFVDSGY